MDALAGLGSCVGACLCAGIVLVCHDLPPDYGIFVLL
jgi:hypothetical protein